MTQSRRKIPESGVQGACIELLTAERIWHMRVNSGDLFASYTSKRTGQTSRRRIKMAKKGTADILCSVRLQITPRHLKPEACSLWTPNFVWLETKAGADGAQSADQLDFQNEVEAQGHTYLIIRSVDDLRDWLRENGVIR